MKKFSLFKYRYPDEKSLNALFSNKTIFSSRKNFNDPFDSDIKIIIPSPKEIYNLKKHVDKRLLNIDSLVEGNCYTIMGDEFIFKIKKMLEELIDSYVFSCYSTTPTNILINCALCQGQ
jgi:hypothetical protein